MAAATSINGQGQWHQGQMKFWCLVEKKNRKETLMGNSKKQYNSIPIAKILKLEINQNCNVEIIDVTSRTKKSLN